MAAHLATLSEDQHALVGKRNELENAYRVFMAEECEMEEEVANKKIAKARLEPQKNKRLKLIHEAHQAVVTKESEITAVEGELAATREVASDTKDQQEEDKVPNSL